MADNKNKKADAPEVDVQELIAKHDALVEEVVELKSDIDALREENEQLRQELDQVRNKTNETASSLQINPTPAPAPERPVVEIGGEKYQFKVAECNIKGKVVKAADVAADEEQLAQFFVDYPGLFKKL